MPLAAAVEAVTVALRFGAGLEARRHASWLGAFAFGWRFHHGYAGALLLLAALPLWRRPAARNALLIAGGALFLSDAIHHFLVLWLVTGDPEFQGLASLACLFDIL